MQQINTQIPSISPLPFWLKSAFIMRVITVQQGSAIVMFFSAGEIRCFTLLACCFCFALQNFFSAVFGTLVGHNILLSIFMMSWIGSIVHLDDCYFTTHCANSNGRMQRKIPFMGVRYAHEDTIFLLQDFNWARLRATTATSCPAEVRILAHSRDVDVVVTTSSTRSSR